MKTFRAILSVFLLLLASACATSANPRPPDPALAQFATIALAPVTFPSHQTLRNERAAIATVLERALIDQLAHKGYIVVAEGSKSADASLSIAITHIWDGRLYGGEDGPAGRLYPELRLYAEVTLTDLASGMVLLRQEVQGSGLIDALLSPAPEARYTAPQRDLAKRISRLFPRR